jgi:hypothetical protein
LFSLAVTFLHSCGGNFSITIARNAWVGYSVYLCVMEDKNCTAQWMVEGTTELKKVLRNGRRKINMKGSMKEKGAGSSWDVICLLL